MSAAAHSSPHCLRRYGPPGCGKCFAAGTLLRLYGGGSVAVEDALPGHALTGDDGQPRIVSRGSLARGRALLYRVTPSSACAAAFTVTAAHILVLSLRRRPWTRRVSHSQQPGVWAVYWYELRAASNELLLLCSLTDSQQQAATELRRRLDRWQPLEWEVSVADFLLAPAEVAAACRLMQRRDAVADDGDDKPAHCRFLYHEFTVAAAGEGEFFGFAVEGGSNRRFLLQDGTVTHNVRAERAAGRAQHSAVPPLLTVALLRVLRLSQSSFIQALAGRFAYNICVLNLSDRGLTDDRLSYLLATTPPRSLLLLEDVDAAFSAQREGRAAGLVTFSGLLNALDGVASTEERVTFLTTNHRSRLDAALIRPGRVDVQQRIGLCSAWQMAEMWRRFYGQEQGSPTDWEAMGRRLLQTLAGLDVSVAELQGFFLLHKGDAQAALAASADWRAAKEEDSRQTRRTAEAGDGQSAEQSAAALSLQRQVERHSPLSPSFIMAR